MPIKIKGIDPFDVCDLEKCERSTFPPHSLSSTIKTIRNYIIAILIVILAWNLIIALFVYNHPIATKRSNLGNLQSKNAVNISCREGCGIYKTDKYGFNNDNDVYNTKRNQTVILSLGDSITEAAQVSRENNYSYLLEKMLNKEKPLFRVINLGVSNLDIDHQIEYADIKMDKFNPDYVLFQVSWYRLGPYLVGNNVPRAFQDEKCIDNKFFCMFYPVARLIINKVRFLQPILVLSRIRMQEFEKQPTNYDDILNKIELMSDNELKNKIRRIKDAYGDNIAFVYRADTPKIVSGEIKLAEAERIKNFLNRFKTLSQDLNISFIDTTDNLANLYKQTRILPTGFNNTVPGTGHLNNEGHNVVAQSIYNFFENNYQINKLMNQ